MADALYEAIPAGVGSHGAVPGLAADDLKRLLSRGAAWARDHGYASDADLDHTEENGCLAMADPDAVSELAYQRGRVQLGTLGSGNHFLECGRIDRIYDAATAAALGLEVGQVMLLIHSGSRGLGHQTCDDYLRVIGAAAGRYGIQLPDRRRTDQFLGGASLPGCDGGGGEFCLVQPPVGEGSAASSNHLDVS